MDNVVIKNTSSKKLLGNLVDNKISFNKHVSGICNKAAQKLHALSRVNHLMTLKQRKLIMTSFILSHFGYCPLVWMFHSRTLNTRINRIHERSLRLIFRDDNSPFKDLLLLNNSHTIHHRNIQSLGIELYKVAYGLSPKIMNEVFHLNPSPIHPSESTFIGRNVKTVSWGTETIAHLSPKIWSLIPANFKKFSLSKFKNKIRNWTPINCPCRLCKTYIKDLGFVEVTK